MEASVAAGAVEPPPGCPDAPALERLLNSALPAEGGVPGPVTVARREPVPYGGTYPTDIVTCRSRGAVGLRLFAKHSGGRAHASHGHRGGVAYEAFVYRHVLRDRDLSAPRLYGAHTDPGSGETSLFLEYIDHAVRASWAPEEALVETARWAGRLHAETAHTLPRSTAQGLARYDRAYYLGWPERTERFAGDLHDTFPWLRAACRGFERVVRVLLEAPTVIHGEYYPKNVLVRDGTPYPVDWESAAVAAGEIDLASITDGWPAGLVAACESAYATARWPQGAPVDFRRRLDIARLYLLLRWLGDRPEWTRHVNVRPLFGQLEDTLERLKLL